MNVQNMIGIIGYGSGNILSVKNAFEKAGADVKVCSHPDEISNVAKLVLPGVGAFEDCIANLKSKGFVGALQEAVLKKHKPILGICLGMQIMAKKSFENGEHTGFGWFDAEVVRLTPQDKLLRIPHVGWNTITCDRKSFLFNGVPEFSDVYFVHSYYMKCNKREDVKATFDYSGEFTAAVRKDNIVGTQFHPEKSQDIGQMVISNFLNWKFEHD